MMASCFRKRGAAPLDPDLASLLDQQRKIEDAIQNLKTLLQEEPGRLLLEEEERRTTMPPPDDIEDRRRLHRFQCAVTRGEIQNERRYQTRNGLFLLLLMGATASIIWWIWQYTHQLP